MRSVLLTLLVLPACTEPAAPTDPTDDGEFDVAKADGSGCLPSVESDDARGLLAYANDPTVTTDELRDLGIYTKAAGNLVAARPFDSLTALDAVPNIGPFACRVLRAQACDVRGLCEAALPLWTWNLKTFPLSGATIDRVAETLDDAEIVGFQEVDSLVSFDELMTKLPGWAGLAGEYGFGTHVAIVWYGPPTPVREINRSTQVTVSLSAAVQVNGAGRPIMSVSPPFGSRTWHVGDSLSTKLA